MGSTEEVFNLANPHAVASLVEASATRSIVASQDIYDEQGTKLLARDQPISASVHERLLARKLRQPLEACLRAEDGITAFQLHQALKEFFDSDHALATLTRPSADRLLDEVKHLPLHSAAQLLLTTTQATQPKVFEHAVRAMALAGAMRTTAASAQYDLRVAMLAGLLHDVGEMYINPAYMDATQRLSMQGYRHVVTHPRIGELLLSTITDYPPALVRAVGEHHERLDGSGYPTRRSADKLSPLGRLLSVMETTLGIVSAPVAPLARASFALRMVAGEYDPQWVGFVSSAASRVQEDLEQAHLEAPAELFGQVALQATELGLVEDQAAALAQRSDVSGFVKDVAANAAERIRRLSASGNSIGMWGTAHAEVSPQSLFELAMATREMQYRMKSIERDCLWFCPPINAQDAAQLLPLWQSLGSGDTPA